MKPGELIELAIWLSGTETHDQIERWKNIDCHKIARETERQNNVVIGPLEFTVKKPGEDRVPPVPSHISGPDVRLLVCEAKTFAVKSDFTSVRGLGFVHDLTPDDLDRLRKLTRRAHAKANPGDRLNNQRCDLIIESLGPEIAVRTLRDGAIH